jgi:hypothetical protein
MSRSGYSEADYDDESSQWAMIRWQGAIKSAIRGRRGQKLLRELLAALDAMPDKRLAAGVFTRADGCVCALGVLGHARGFDVSVFDVDAPTPGEECCDHWPDCSCGDYEPDHDGIAKAFGVAAALAREIMWVNDETSTDDSVRWRFVRGWVARQIHA